MTALGIRQLDHFEGARKALRTRARPRDLPTGSLKCASAHPHYASS